MVKQLIQFEFYYQCRQRAFLLLSLLFLMLGYFCGQQGFALDQVHFNSEYQIIFYTSLFTLGAVFIIMFFANNGVLRDRRYQMEAIMYSTSMSKITFFGIRFLGVFISSLLAFTPFILGYITGIALTDLDPSRLSHFSIFPYLRAWLFFVVPNILLCSSLLFAISLLAKNAIATYIGAIFIYMLYMISSMFLNSPLLAQSVPASPETMSFAAIMDPLGIAAFYEQTHYWTPAQKNSEHLAFSGLFMWNRILWISISLLINGISYQLFSFRKLQQKTKKKIGKLSNTSTVSNYRPINPVISIKSQCIALFSLLTIELKYVFKNIPFIAIMLMWLVIITTEFYNNIYNGGAYNDSIYPFTNLLIDLMVTPMTTLSIILIIFYSGELLWKERSFNFNYIIDATPVYNSTLFISKSIALLLLPLVLITIGIFTAIFFQLLNGSVTIDLWQYIALYYFYGLKICLYAIIAICIQSFVSNKYLGMGITGLVIFGSLISYRFGIEHPLLTLGAIPKPNYTDMNGFSKDYIQYSHLISYWISGAGVAIIFAFKTWQRGINKSILYKLKQIRSNWKLWQYINLASCVLVFIVMGSMVFYNTNIVTNYTTIKSTTNDRETYERKFKKYETLKKLIPSKITTRVALFPKKDTYTIAANYTLKNNNETSIDSVLITERIPLKNITLENAVLTEYDSILGTYLFRFEEAVIPSQEINFKFSIQKELTGYETSRNIISNGSYITHRDFDPVLSYRKSIEIQDPFERKKRGLPELIKAENTDQHIMNKEFSMEKVTFETIISTDIEQTAITTGNLIRKWEQGNRSFYEYKTKHPILPSIAYFSAKYKKKTANFEGIRIEQYYDKKHDYNIATIEKSTQQALEYCIQNFGKYHDDHIRIAEIPAHWQFGGFAHPGVISMVEDRLYLTDLSNDPAFNLVAKRTIHEVAHQWWGHILSAKPIAGGSLLVEGFAKYTEGVVMEKHYGKGALWQLSQTANNRYFNGRAHAASNEVPMYKVDGQSYISYGKSYIIMQAVKELIGEEKLNIALHELILKHQNDSTPKVHSIHFLDELYKVTPKEHHQLIDDWFKRMFIYELELTAYTYQKLADGTYQISITVKSNRNEIIENGQIKKATINEPITIGIFSEHPSNIKDEHSIIHLEKYEFTKEMNTYKIITTELPTYISIDPFGTRLEENRENNIIKL